MNELLPAFGCTRKLKSFFFPFRWRRGNALKFKLRKKKICKNSRV